MRGLPILIGGDSEKRYSMSMPHGKVREDACRIQVLYIPHCLTA
jgi:hypothetical protein